MLSVAYAGHLLPVEKDFIRKSEGLTREESRKDSFVEITLKGVPRRELQFVHRNFIQPKFGTRVKKIGTKKRERERERRGRGRKTTRRKD